MRINQFTPVQDISTYRKIALGTWRDAGDPSTYTWLEVDVQPAREYLQRVNYERAQAVSSQFVRISLAHLVAHALSTALVAQPELNTVLRWGKLYRRPRVDAFHQVLLLGRGRNRLRNPDQGGCVVRGTEDLTGFEQAEEHARTLAKSRAGETEAAQMQRQLIPLVPQWIMPWFLKVSSFLVYAVNRRLSFLGLSEDPFGSFIISDVGALGAEGAFMPLAPYTRVGLFVGVGKVSKRPWVGEDGELTVREVARICITFDHRLAEGFHLSEMQRVFLRCLANPAEVFPLTPRQAALLET